MSDILLRAQQFPGVIKAIESKASLLRGNKLARLMIGECMEQIRSIGNEIMNDARVEIKRISPIFEKKRIVLEYHSGELEKMKAANRHKGRSFFLSTSDESRRVATEESVERKSIDISQLAEYHDLYVQMLQMEVDDMKAIIGKLQALL